MDKDLKTILKEKMNERGISTPKLGKRLGIPADRIYAWYRDNTNPKGPDSLTIQNWIEDETFMIKNEETSVADAIYKAEDGKTYLIQAKGFPASEPTPMGILDRLSQAFIDQAKALADQAEGFKAQAEAFRLHTELLKSIESKMAREETQARIETNSTEILAGVKALSIRQKRAIAENKKDLAELKSQKPHRGRGSGKKSDQTDGADEKRGKRPPSGS